LLEFGFAGLNIVVRLGHAAPIIEAVIDHYVGGVDPAPVGATRQRQAIRHRGDSTRSSGLQQGLWQHSMDDRHCS
jgi:hypothetical protein